MLCHEPTSSFSPLWAYALGCICLTLYCSQNRCIILSSQATSSLDIQATHCVPSFPRQYPHVVAHHALCSVQFGDCRPEGRALLNLRRTRGHRTDELWGVCPDLVAITSSCLAPLGLYVAHKVADVSLKHCPDNHSSTGSLQYLGVTINLVPRASMKESCAVPTLMIYASRHTHCKKVKRTILSCLLEINGILGIICRGGQIPDHCAWQCNLYCQVTSSTFIPKTRTTGTQSVRCFQVE